MRAPRCCVLVILLGCAELVFAQHDAGTAEATISSTSESMLKVFPLRHASAEEMQRLLVELMGPSAGPDSRQGFVRSDRATASSLRTSADTRTNTLLVNGPEADFRNGQVVMMLPREQEHARTDSSR